MGMRMRIIIIVITNNHSHCLPLRAARSATSLAPKPNTLNLNLHGADCSLSNLPGAEYGFRTRRSVDVDKVASGSTAAALYIYI